MGGLFSKPSIPPPPPIPPTPTMPDTQSPGVLEAQRQAVSQMQSKSGRRSTILDTSNPNPTAPYSQPNLGSNPNR